MSWMSSQEVQYWCEKVGSRGELRGSKGGWILLAMDTAQLIFWNMGNCDDDDEFQWQGCWIITDVWLDSHLMSRYDIVH